MDHRKMVFFFWLNRCDKANLPYSRIKCGIKSTFVKEGSNNHNKIIYFNTKKLPGFMLGVFANNEYQLFN